MNIFIKYPTPQRNEKFRKELLIKRGCVCECCGAKEWLNKPINLELHHKDGDRSNCEEDNLELLCPNCHSYTDNYGSKNKKHIDVSDEEFIEALKQSSSIRQALFAVGLSDAGANYNRARTLINQHKISLASKKQMRDKENYCIDCGAPIYPESTRCIQCEAKNRQTFQITREDLKALIRTTPFTKIGNQYNVSDNAVRKWCDKYGLPRKSADIKKYSDEEWEQI